MQTCRVERAKPDRRQRDSCNPQQAEEPAVRRCSLENRADSLTCADRDRNDFLEIGHSEFLAAGRSGFLAHSWGAHPTCNSEAKRIFCVECEEEV